jgi:hypothetical protein
MKPRGNEDIDRDVQQIRHDLRVVRWLAAAAVARLRS